jgi:TolA-binding protein
VQFEQNSFLSSAKAFEELLKDAPKNLVVSAAWQAGEARRQLALVAKGDAQNREFRAALTNYELVTKVPVKEKGNQSELQDQSLLRIGQTRASLEDWNAAQEAFEQFVKNHPKHKLIRTAHLGFGWAVHNQEKYPEAIASYEKVVKDGVRDDTGARAQFLLGECYLEQKHLVKARTEFSKVEVLYAFPLWQSKALYEMGRAFSQDNQSAEARKVFMQLIEKYPDTSGAAAAKDELKRLN